MKKLIRTLLCLIAAIGFISVSACSSELPGAKLEPIEADTNTTVTFGKIQVPISSKWEESDDNDSTYVMNRYVIDKDQSIRIVLSRDKFALNEKPTTYEALKTQAENSLSGATSLKTEEAKVDGEIAVKATFTSTGYDDKEINDNAYYFTVNTTLYSIDFVKAVPASVDIQSLIDKILPKVKIEKTVQIVPVNIEITDHNEGSEYYYFNVVVKNPATSDIKVERVGVELLDKDNNVVDSTYAFSSPGITIAPDKTGAFECKAKYSQNVSKVRVTHYSIPGDNGPNSFEEVPLEHPKTLDMPAV
ncbi:hypothetical protein D2E26_0136 [Bifidobacterium dolichotidis]|uniref:Lipoprotein n=1 Tax=Bifidobacterium dolichotidis TaxID=2306976 RepID=A0A430FRV2_9BIFI|nr:hypothetical protein [Bifidobacterium dolichotidis]RSX55573.1 hypothetical protein D2E26_0136 [Bifidobacterium dolichotidis]